MPRPPTLLRLKSRSTTLHSRPTPSASRSAAPWFGRIATIPHTTWWLWPARSDLLGLTGISSYARFWVATDFSATQPLFWLLACNWLRLDECNEPDYQGPSNSILVGLDACPGDCQCLSVNSRHLHATRDRHCSRSA